MDNEIMESEVERLKTRAKNARRLGWLGVAIMVATVMAMIVLFSNSGIEASIPINTTTGKVALDNPNMSMEAIQKLEAMRFEVENKRAEALASNFSSSLMITAVSSGIARVGSVLIALYLVQVLLTITRYHFRIADHCDSAASILVLSKDKDLEPSNLISLLSTSHVEFSKAPEAPTEKILELVKEIVSKGK